MDKPRLLLTGASGFIGSRLRQALGPDWEVLGTGLHNASQAGLVRLDLADPSAIERVFAEAAPAAVAHTAGIAGPDEAEKDPELTRKVNCDAPALLARLCARSGARLVHFSTDLVFDGEGSWYQETDAPRPINVYGRAKLDAEKSLLDACPGAVILRVATVYGRALSGRPSFLDTLHEKLSRGEKVGAFVDQWRTATPCAQLAEVVAALLRRSELRGIFHWTGAQRSSRWEFACEFCRAFGLPESLVEPGHMAEARFPAPRPRDTSLSSAKLSGLLGMPLWTLRQGLMRARQEWAA